MAFIKNITGKGAATPLFHFRQHYFSGKTIAFLIENLYFCNTKQRQQ